MSKSRSSLLLYLLPLLRFISATLRLSAYISLGGGVGGGGDDSRHTVWTCTSVQRYHVTNSQRWSLLNLPCSPYKADRHYNCPLF